MADYKINDIYQGNYSSLKPSYGNSFTGYRAKFSDVGITTDPRTANILQEVSSKIAPGQSTAEVTLIQQEIFDSVPKQHLEEVNRLAKLTGVDLTVHGPLVEPSGIGREGFNEALRQAVERQLFSVMERSHLINPKGHVPVTFHSSASLPTLTETIKTKEGEITDKMLVINQETGSINVAKRNEKIYPGIGKEDISPERELAMMNHSEWQNSLSSLATQKKYVDEMVGDSITHLAPIINKKEITQEDLIEISNDPEKRAAYEKLNRAKIFLDDANSTFSSLYNKASKYPLERKEVPKEVNLAAKEILKDINDQWKQIRKSRQNEEGSLKTILIESQALNESIAKLQQLEKINWYPEAYVPLKKFAEEKSVETFANVALHSYKKFKDNAPIISIENPPAGQFAFSKGEDLKNMVEKSRQKFAEKASLPKNQGGLGVSESEAKKIAERMIGVTWDVGHINMLRKHGYDEKDIVKETEKVAPYVKHVHLSDNFGIEHTELPMGMGNVPLKEMMAKLGKKGEEAKKIVEAASWFQHFKTSPLAVSAEGLGSPIYSMKMQPYWNQAIGYHQDYLSGYGEMLPSINYQTFGAGFSQLPRELGGQMGQGGSRMSGRPLE